MEYESTRRIESKQVPGVAFTIARVSFGRRMELARRIRDALAKIEFLEAGKDPREKLDAALLAAEVDRICLLWALTGVEGLMLDGAPATPEKLIDSGPEALCREIVATIRRELGLSGEERKNS